MTGAATALAQAAPAVSPYYARTNTFSVFGAYSGDSSHIFMGDAENRKLLDFGVAYGRKFFLNLIVNWQYNGELLPVALESDPVVLNTINLTGPTVHIEYETTVQTTPCILQLLHLYLHIHMHKAMDYGRRHLSGRLPMEFPAA